MNLFQFKRVGQGLFYTGTIMNEYNFVYDCGSSNGIEYVQREIDNMELPNNSRDINFVVISHLHSDHFNGLPLLLDKFKIHKVYLPYLGEDKTLIQFILANEILGSGMQEWYSRRLYSLMCYFYGIKLEFDGFNFREEYVPYADFLGEIQNYDEGMKINHVGYKVTDLKKDVTKCYAYKEIYYLWNFIFINRTFSYEKIKYASEVIRNYFVKCGCDKITPDNINEIILKKVREPLGMYELNTVYFDAFGINQNITSTVLIHYPKIISSRIVFGDYTSLDDFGEHIIRHNKFRLNGNLTVLTGDAEFDKDMLKIVGSYLKRRRDGLLQVPHHGSYSNWKKLKKLPKKISAFVIPVGNNKYGHPNEQIFYEVSKLRGNHCIKCATEYNGVYYYVE